MPDLVMLVPSRGRPDATEELADIFYYREGSNVPDVQLRFVVDESDPTLPKYVEALRPGELVVTPSSSMVEALNMAAAMELDSNDPPFALGFMGDDHRPRTRGWDAAYLDKLRELGTGMVFGDDLIQHGNLPTQIAMTSDIVAALGWMAPPDLFHMYVDNWWLQLGTRTGCIRYLPDVVVEHVHPVTGKVGWDEGHTRVNAAHVYQRDAATFARLQALELPRAVDKVRALRSAR